MLNEGAVAERFGEYVAVVKLRGSKYTAATADSGL